MYMYFVFKTAWAYVWALNLAFAVCLCYITIMYGSGLGMLMAFFTTIKRLISLFLTLSYFGELKFYHLSQTF